MKEVLTLILLAWITQPVYTQKIIAESNIPGEKAVQGINTDNTSSSSYGLFGRSYHGLQLFADGTTGFAGVGTANGVNGIGFYGIAEGVNGFGVLGLHNNIAGTVAGVEGRSASISSSASGVRGEITSTSPGGLSAGVRGVNNGTGGLGIGVYGSHAGNGWGVHGTVPGGSTGWAGVFTGGKGVYVAPKIGINKSNPPVELVVSQLTEVESVVDETLSSLAGLMIEAVDNNAVLMYIDATEDLNFAFGSGTTFIQRAYIWKPTGDFIVFSDERLKENIRTMEPVLDKVLELTPSWYSFKDDNNETAAIGFMAQEVQKLFPEIVHEKDGKLALAYDKFAVLAVKAIQEQQKFIDEMSDRLARLESVNCQEK